MRIILVLGAGRSSSALIKYLLESAAEFSWKVLVADISEAAVRDRIGDSPFGEYVPFNVNDEHSSVQTIKRADVVISLLPPVMHPHIGSYCLTAQRHLLTASYVSPDMQKLHLDAEKQGLLFLNECGLDPGIDHMSAMQVINRIKEGGGRVFSFESFTGGLITPETDPENPWRYKFTWNPRNVVTAGQGTALYLESGAMKYIPYHQLFRRTTRISVPGLGDFEGYANRDSLKYIDTYSLKGVETMLRGTLRFAGFCDAWNVLVQLGCCDDTYQLDGRSSVSPLSFIESFLPGGPGTLKERVSNYTGVSIDSHAMKCLEWSGFFNDEPLGLDAPTPAQVTEHILHGRWDLKSGDRDLVVMWHRFKYEKDGKTKTIEASLISRGENSSQTAMAKTVGLPLGIAAKLLMTGNLTARGVVVPVSQEFYDPILRELKTMGISLTELEY